MTDCPFCTLPKERIKFMNDLGMVIRDGYPISQGHTLIIPKGYVTVKCGISKYPNFSIT